MCSSWFGVFRRAPLAVCLLLMFACRFSGADVSIGFILKRVPVVFVICCSVNFSVPVIVVLPLRVAVWAIRFLPIIGRI